MALPHLNIVSIRDLEFRLRIRQKELKRLARQAPKFYRPFMKPRSGQPDNPRIIDRPVGLLKLVQRRIYTTLLAPLAMPAHIHGGIRKRSPKTNATVHIGCDPLVKMDIKGFFPSISNLDVYSLWHSILGCSTEVSKLLTHLTTYQRRLPQGASTSTALANIYLEARDQELRQYLDSNNIVYSKFLDDISLSGGNVREAINAFLRGLMSIGFKVSHKKLKVMGSNKPKEITGVRITPKGINLPKKKISNTRAAIHKLKFLPKETLEYERQIQRVHGLLNHIGYISPEAKLKLETYLRRVNEKTKPLPSVSQ